MQRAITRFVFVEKCIRTRKHHAGVQIFTETSFLRLSTFDFSFASQHSGLLFSSFLPWFSFFALQSERQEIFITGYGHAEDADDDKCPLGCAFLHQHERVRVFPPIGLDERSGEEQARSPAGSESTPARSDQPAVGVASLISDKPHQGYPTVADTVVNLPSPDNPTRQTSTLPFNPYPSPAKLVSKLPEAT